MRFTGNLVTIMARLPFISLDDATPEVRALFEKDRARTGQVLNTTRIGAYRPAIAAAARALGQAVAGSGLIEPQLRCLINVRIAGLVGCEF